MEARGTRPKLLLLVLGTVLAGAQTQKTVPAPAATTTASAALPREIRDPQTGQRWILVRDAEHPRWPARLQLVDGSGAAGGAGLPPALPQPVIRGGDAIVVVESTPVLEARYDAVALGSAEKGKAMNARLKVNGKVVHAVALGPGRAALVADFGGRR